MLPENESGDDEYLDYGRGIRRKLNRKNTDLSSSIQSSKPTPVKGVKKDEKAFQIHSALSKALPTILSEATSEISFRLGEHRLGNLRESIVSHRLRSIVQAWRCELELRVFLSQGYKTYQRRRERKGKESALKFWKQFFFIRSFKQRWHGKILFRIELAAKERIFTAWACVKKQYRHLIWIIERKAFSILRNILLSWKDLKSKKVYRKLVLEKATIAKSLRLLRLCLHGMIAVARSSTCFFNMTSLVLKCRRYDVYPAFRSWKDYAARKKGFKVSSLKIEAQHSRRCWDFSFSGWCDQVQRTRRLRGIQSSLARLISDRSMLIALAHWNSTVRIYRWMVHCEQTIGRHQIRRLMGSVFEIFASFVMLRRRMVVTINRIVSNRNRRITCDAFCVLLNFLLAHRKRYRALRMRDVLFINRVHGFVMGWAACGRRARRFRKLMQQVTRSCNKSSLSVQSRLDAWKRCASVYWIAWRKIDKFRNRTAYKTKSMYFIFWLRDWKIKSNYSIFTVRFCSKKLSNCFYLWSEHVDVELLRMQEIHEGTDRLITKRRYLARTSAIDFWHMKTFLRARVKQLAVRNHELRLQGTQHVARSLLHYWMHIVKCRNDRLTKLDFLETELYRKKSSLLVRVWADAVKCSKNLCRKQRLLERTVSKRLAKSAFQCLDYHSENMQRRRAVFERNAIRSEYQTFRIHFEIWVSFRGQSRLLNNRLQHFIKFRTTHYCARSAFILWYDKHSRSVGFDQRLFLKFLAVKRKSLKGWCFFVQDQKDLSKYISMIHSRYNRRIEKDLLQLWKLATHQSVVITKRAKVLHDRHTMALIRSCVSIWHSRQYHAMNKKATMNKVELQSNNVKRTVLKNWRIVGVQFKRVSNQLERISNRICRRSLNFIFEILRLGKLECKSLKTVQQKIRDRRHLNILIHTIKAWTFVLQYSAALARFFGKLRFKQDRVLIVFGFRCFSITHELALEKSISMEQLHKKDCKTLLTKTCRFWFQDVVIYKRNMFAAVNHLMRKIRDNSRSRILQQWIFFCWKEKEMILKIESWELRTVKSTFEKWTAIVLSENFKKTKIHQLHITHQTKILGWIFLSWRDCVSFNKKRRWSLQFFCDKSVTRFCSVAFRAFAMIAILERRRQVIVANVQRWTDKRKLTAAAQYLIMETRKARIRRQLLERGYIKYLSRSVKTCWASWASKVSNKKQTTAVLAKAGAVLIDMM